MCNLQQYMYNWPVYFLVFAWAVENQILNEMNVYRASSHDVTQGGHVGVPKQRNSGHDGVPN